MDMPQALAFIAPGVFGVGGSIALVGATGALTLAGSIASIGGGLILSAVAAPSTPAGAKPENIQTNSKVATAPRVGHYGYVKAGGNTVFHRAKDGFSYRIIAHGHGEIDGVEAYFLNKDAVDLDASGFVTDDQYQLSGSRVQIIGRDGAVPSPHFPEVTAIWDEWTAAHRLDGLWASLIVCESVPADKYRAMYPNNEPELTAVARSKKCYDPRTLQTAFTENMALAIADYVSSPDGFNRPNAFDATDIAEQADICERDVLLATGGTEKLYRVGGSYQLTEDPQNVLGRMLAACAGRVRLKPSGKASLKVGAWTQPEFVLTYDDLIEVQEVNNGPDLLDRYNELPARFNSQALGYTEVDAEPWRDEGRIEADGTVLTGPDKPLIMCPSHRQARQAMKIHMERDNPTQEVRLLCKPRTLPAVYEDAIVLDIPQMGLSGTYEVSKHSIAFEKGLLRAVGLTLRKVDPAAFTLALDEQGEVQQMPEPDTSAGVPLPQNVVAAAAGVQTATNTFTAGIGVVWEAPPSDALSIRLRLQKDGVTSWQEVPVSSGAVSASIPGLIDGQAYHVEVSFITPGGLVGDPVTVSDVIASADANAPAAPTGLTVTDQTGGVALVEFTTSATASLWKSEIYRDAVLIGTSFAAPNILVSITDASGAGSFDWTVKAVNVSDKGTETAPVSATIT